LSKFKARNFPESLNYAWQGLVHAFRTERNVRVHFYLAVLVTMLGFALRLPALEMAVLVLTISLVIASEMANTALEAVVDMVTDDYHPLAAAAKNVAAGMVLIASTAAVGVGYLLFFERLVKLRAGALVRTVATPPYVTFFALLLAVFVVTAIKVSAKPARLQGGMPSLHTAAAASLATAVFFVSHSDYAVVLAAFIAALVAQSRLEARIHTWLEVIAGGVLGTLLTVLAFQLLM
jgi:diacylglycerol kinase (ATP)